ncbi:Anaphase-promoting complex subunit 4 [Hibiscus syriacus]|uniref:Anaphase-promoting complex subunit 4 n=1 Tax=Hibiscus syriacus TaxID=106335 RepID=A0A6A3CZ78_HIBSY|nr:Anaphase-promoting complex subunit 4 [Hibiscus syriacus]
METDETPRVLPFQLQFDKPVASQIKFAEWNPEKDLLAMVTEDSKILLHRFNWQRLWTIFPGRCITSLCWRPDGKAIAVGLEDGTISLHDVENGKLLRSLKSHNVAVVSLNWEEDGQAIKDDSVNSSSYEDRTSCFFPPAPRVPRMPGLAPGDTGFMDDSEDSFPERQLGMHGFHCLLLDSSIFWKRKSELRQIAQQASNIEDLIEVIRTSLSVMSKQWKDAMLTFHEKFDSLSRLIMDHGLDSSPQEEFLSLLGGARTSPPVHQFLVNSLGELGVKRVSMVICGAGKELQHVVLDHLQPAAEIICFRMGELRGLSRWRTRFQGIGLDETLINNATEKSGILLSQLERFMRVLSSVVQQVFSNFFNWLLKCIKLLMQEPSDQLLPYISELVIFLKFLYDQDPVRPFLELSEADIETEMETVQRVRELVHFGGFSDCEYLRRTLAEEFKQMEISFKEAFLMPFTTISRKMLCKDVLPLFALPYSPASVSFTVPMSVTYYKDASAAISSYQTPEHGFIDYISFQIPGDSSSNIANCIGISRGFMHSLSNRIEESASLEAILLSVPDGYHCVDLSLYKDGQIVLLLNETTDASESSGESCMMIVQANELPFLSIPRSSCVNTWNLDQLKDSVMHLQPENEKVRNIPHSVVAPLAVSASRGVACVFAARKRALVYIMDEDEDDVSDTE